MPDSRTNRGPHPSDRQLFAADQLPKLRTAARDYAWLISRGYPADATLKLVGDRHDLVKRQRTAIRRTSCSDAALASRLEREKPLVGCDGVAIDGFNLLITIEAALSGGVVLIGREGCCRDLASIHGTYRRVKQTQGAIELVAQQLARAKVGRALWLLDRPVSNSGKLRALIAEHGRVDGVEQQIELLDDPDGALVRQSDPVVSSDGQVLDAAASWVNLARTIIAESVQEAWLVDLSLGLG